jgi:hypothetical protein
MQLERHCSCGKSLYIKLPREKRDAALAIWFAYHHGAGHQPATRKQAQEARRNGRA